jgi:hypothetical protein
MRAALARYEAPFVTQLRVICEEIGYDRVIQLAEDWIDKKHPGWVKAHHKVYMERSAKEPHGGR